MWRPGTLPVAGEVSSRVASPLAPESSAMGHSATGDQASLTLLPTKIVYVNSCQI